LNSDLGHWTATKLNPNSSTGLDSHAEGGQNKVDWLSTLIEEDWLISWHWCTHVENILRGRDIKDLMGNPIEISSSR